MRTALNDTTIDDVHELLGRIRRHAYIDAFAHGNIDADTARGFARRLWDAWRTCADRAIPQTTVAIRLLTPGSTSTWARPSFNPTETNSVHVSYYQWGADSVEGRAQLKFLQRLSSENCFDCLRYRPLFSIFLFFSFFCGFFS